MKVKMGIALYEKTNAPQGGISSLMRAPGKAERGTSAQRRAPRHSDWDADDGSTRESGQSRCGTRTQQYAPTEREKNHLFSRTAELFYEALGVCLDTAGELKT